MKRIASLFSMILLAVLIFNSSPQKAEAIANTWKFMGNAGFASSDLIFNPLTNELYGIANYTIKKYDGASWIDVGNSIDNVGTSGIIIAFDNLSNGPYIAFLDTSLASRITVKKFDGTNWVTVGTSGFTSNDASDISLSINPSTGYPYVAYQDGTSLKATAKKFDGSSWIDVGTPGFSAGNVDYVSIAFNPSTNEPYVAYEDMQNSAKTSVMRFDGSSWVAVGSLGFSNGIGHNSEISFNPLTSEPYVSYINGNYSSNLNVMKFDGSNWISVGAANFESGINPYGGPVIKFDNASGKAYIAFKDTSTTLKIMSFNGSNWIDVGSSINNSDYDFSLAINQLTSEPYISYVDRLHSFGPSVMRFSSNSVEDPIASLATGVFDSSQSITLSTTTSGADIYYTTNSDTPTATSIHYTGTITISQNTTLKFIATKSTMGDSDVISEYYGIKNTIPIASPASGTYYSYPQLVTLSTTTDGADIYYTTNGDMPTASSTHYTGAITVASSETIKAITIKANMANSDIMTESYVIVKASAPTASPVGGTYNSSQSVTLSTTTDGADIYYTTNGDTPTISSTHYTGAITVSTSQTLKAIAVKSGMGDSDVMSESYIIIPYSLGVSSNGSWYIDNNDNNAWNGSSVDTYIANFGKGLSNVQAVTGDWNGDGTAEIGVFSNGAWYLDLNGNGAWNGSSTDTYIANFGKGLSNAQAVTGDWDGDGTTEIGVFSNGYWYLDYNGNNAWNGTSTDKAYSFGFTGASAVTGDWDGDGITNIAVFSNGYWYVDNNNNGAWNGSSIDKAYSFGFTGATPVSGDWDGDNISEIGVFSNGRWYLDYNSNGAWNGSSNDTYIDNFGKDLSNAKPIVLN